MITVNDFAKKLRKYVQESPENANAEVMLAFETGVAFPFLVANSTTAMSANANVRQFLVLMPDIKGDRLELNQIGH